jgi:hypothetical protein
MAAVAQEGIRHWPEPRAGITPDGSGSGMICASKDQLGLNLNQLLLMVSLFFKHDLENIFGSHELFLIRGRPQPLNETALTGNAHHVVSDDA